MTTIVGIFDNARDLDQAVERLAEAGIEDTVFDETIVAGEAGNVGQSGPGSSTPGIIGNLSCHPSRTGTPLSGPLRPILPIITCLRT